MASPKSIPSLPAPKPAPVSFTTPDDTTPVSIGTPPIIPQIPARNSSSSKTNQLFANSISPNDSTTDVKAKGSSDSLNRWKQASSPSSRRPSAKQAGFHLPTPLNSVQNVETNGLDAAVIASGSSTPQTGTPINGATDDDKARVIRRHLVSAEERSSGRPTPTSAGPSPAPFEQLGSSQGGLSLGVASQKLEAISGESSSSQSQGYGSTGERNPDDEFPIPFDALGGDVTHDIYKWENDHRTRPNRAASFSGADLDRSVVLGDPTLAHIKEPGGFRRNFVVNRAQEQEIEPPTVTRNVIDFLFYYGHFAGEDLEEDEDVLDEDDDDGRGVHATQTIRSILSRESSVGERTSLLGRARSKSRHRRTRSGPATGTATVPQAILMLLKGFVGTGILFMARAFFSGGLLFSTIVMLAIAAISLWAFLMLTSTYNVVPGSFGDIGGILYGNYMRLAILSSIAISQIGFVTAYIIFIAENLQAFILAVTDCKTYIPIRYLIFGELFVFMPLAMIRNLAKLSGTALIADAFILIGLIYIGANEVGVLIKHGIAPDVVMFNPESFPLLIGTAVFAFEGIGLVIPISESMREPRKFPPILCGVMFIVATLFAGFGWLGYAAYGSSIRTVVIVNLPQDDKLVQVVQCLYSLAILLSIPLQLFPAVRIMENGLFSKSGKHNPSVKWQKNMFRAITVVCCSLVSWAGSNELDKFVSLIGSFACIPLCFIYPPLLHLKAVARSRTARSLDYLMLIFGIGVGIFTTVQTLRSLFTPSTESTQFGKCKVPEDA